MSEDSNQEDTQAEQPLSLREELVKGLAEQTEEVTEDANTPDEEESNKDTTEAEEATEDEGSEAVAEEEVKDTATEDADVPNNWNAEEKKAFEDIPDEIITEDGVKISLKAMKDVVLNRNEELLKAFMEKSREVSVEKKANTEWNNLLDPYKPQLNATGQSAQQWIGSILQTVHKLQADPKVVIKEFIDTYKVSATDLGFNAAQSDFEDDFHGESDPRVTTLETTVKAQAAEIEAMRSEGVQRNNQTVQGEIVTFKAETDSKGSLTHPHFNEAREEMGILMEAGRAKTMQEAYDMSPTVRSKGLEVVRTPSDNKAALKKAREEAAKAKKAGKTVRTRSGQSTNHLEGVSLRDELQAGLRAQQ